MGSDLQMVNREAHELGLPPVPSSPRLQYCGFTVHGSAQTCYDDAWSFMFVLKVLTWHLATPWGPGEPVGGSVTVLTAGRCSLLVLRAWRPLCDGGNGASVTPATPAWMTLTITCSTKNRNQPSGGQPSSIGWLASR